MIPVRYVLLSDIIFPEITRSLFLLFNLPAARLSLAEILLLHCHPLPCHPAAPSSRYPAAASSCYHSTASPHYHYQSSHSIACLVPPVAGFCSLACACSMPCSSRCPRSSGSGLVVVVTVPVVPQLWFSPHRRWCLVSQVVVGSLPRYNPHSQ